MKRSFLAMFCILPFLTACFEKPPVITTTPQKIKKPTIQFQMPPKQPLQPIEWDFPRTTNQIQIKNNKKCLDMAKKMGFKPVDLKGVFDPTNEKISSLPEDCKVPAIDNGSNLYIGLTEANYRSLVNNYNILMLREQQWVKLLEQINKQLRLMNEGQ